MRKKLKEAHAAVKKKNPWLSSAWKLSVIAGIVLIWRHEHEVTEGVVSFAIVLEKCFDMVCGEIA